MTVHGDYRYCNDAAFTQFNEWSWWYRLGHRMKRRCGIPSQPIPVPDPADESSGRTIAFAPGAPLARRFFADQQAVLKLGGSVFVHGGLLLEHLPVGLAELNRISQGWISGRDAGASIPSFLRGRRALVWSRRFSRVDETECRCDELEQVLEKSVSGGGGGREEKSGWILTDHDPTCQLQARCQAHGGWSHHPASTRH